MKRFLSVFLGAISLLSLFVFVDVSLVEARSTRSSSSDVYVNGYYRSNGTYVQPYYRSAPDSSVYNNYSCIDSGRCGNSTTTYTPSTVYTPVYTTPIIIPQTCYDKYGFWAVEDTLGGCKCMSWYMVNSITNKCEVKTVYNSCADSVNGYLWGDGKCYCNSGYEWNNTINICTAIPPPKTCYEKYGLGAIDDTTWGCKCGAGFLLNKKGDACEVQTTENTCMDTINGYLSTDGKCYCNVWYTWNNTTSSCVAAKVNKVTYVQTIRITSLRVEKKALSLVVASISAGQTGILVDAWKDANGQYWFLLDFNGLKWWVKSTSSWKVQ